MAQDVSKNVRALAAVIVNEVITHKHSLPAVIAERMPVDFAQRPLLYEMCYGTLRWFFRLKSISELLLHKPLPAKKQELFCLLLIGLHQLLNMKVPEYAAVSETVKAAVVLGQPWAKGLINKNMRRFLEEKDELLKEADKTAEGKYDHPKWLIKLIKEAWPQEGEHILMANNLRAPLTLRVNALQNSRDEYRAILQAEGVSSTPLSELDTALNIDEPMPIDAVPGFKQGCASVQDISGQFAAGLLDLQPGQVVLDACSAPGSKTTHIIEMQPKLKRLVAIEKDAARLAMIRQNIERLKLPHDFLSLVLADAAHTKEWWNGEHFSRILVDAPCSGLGVIRRHPDIKILRQPNDIESAHQQQVHLLKQLWPLLESKGLLLYSTCSTLPQENEHSIAVFLQQHQDVTVLPLSLPIGIKQKHGWQILPTADGSDGFYYCLLQKT